MNVIRLTTAVSSGLDPSSLVGSYFHGDQNSQQRQGCIVAEPHPGYYLVELTTGPELAGASVHQELVHISDMTGWRFYDNAAWMNKFESNSVSG